MQIFSEKNKKLIPVKEISFGLEKNVQKLTEANLETIFGLEFVATEFNLENFWLDTLAFNPEIKAFVIIEYKKKQNITVMDQGQTYLNLLLDHKAEVLLEYNERKNKNLKRKDVDWEQTRVIFVAPEFTIYQKRALHPKFPFQLWEVKKYEKNNFISYNQIQPLILERTGQRGPSLSGRALKEIKVYTEEDIYKQCSPLQKIIIKEAMEFTEDLSGDFQKIVGKNSVSYKCGTKKSFVNFGPSDEKIRIYFQEGDKLNDKEGLLEGRGEHGRYIKIKTFEELEKVKNYIIQAYEISKKE
ncbi:MAG: hypothetical protein AUJ31_01025 [Parcubacteria group bacterium CG1_02_39_15]|nr:MAG: hypothetical protein AUJ31_01025 [Parcubacteria group bacterium CG1_02_39_15]